MFYFENGRRLCVTHFRRIHIDKLIGDLEFFCDEIFTKANLSYFNIYMLGEFISNCSGIAHSNCQSISLRVTQKISK